MNSIDWIGEKVSELLDIWLPQKQILLVEQNKRYQNRSQVKFMQIRLDCLKSFRTVRHMRTAKINTTCLTK